MPGPGGGTGIRRGLKSPGREACGFDSRPGHRASHPFGVATGHFAGASVRMSSRGRRSGRLCGSWPGTALGDSHAPHRSHHPAHCPAGRRGPAARHRACCRRARQSAEFTDDGRLRGLALRPESGGHLAAGGQPGLHRHHQRRPGRERGRAGRRHPLGQAVLHRGVRPQIAALWTRFDDSLVYTPGDNEWADCHKVAAGRRALQPHDGPDPLPDRSRDRSAGRLRQGRPAGQPRPGPLAVLPGAGPDAGQRHLQVQSQATSLRPGPPRATPRTSRTSGGSARASSSSP